MSRKRKVVNPFYPLLVVAGAVFAITAFAYGVMALAAVRTPLATSEAAHPLWAWLSAHGDVTLLSEIAVLGVLTFAAIGTDDYWDRLAQQKQTSETPSE